MQGFFDAGKQGLVARGLDQNARNAAAVRSAVKALFVWAVNSNTGGI